VTPAPPASFWHHKPWWCQPWSIVITGVGVILGSWWLLQRWWISLPIAAAVFGWWWLFLVLAPAAFAAAETSGQTAADPTEPAEAIALDDDGSFDGPASTPHKS
jgi:hypothetical protein